MIVVDRPDNELKISSNLTDIGTFKIKESAKAFRILSSSLYSNKIRAIVRELTCNARDSHVEAGNTEQYIVHLPTTLEPTFSVEDFGVGLDHESVMKLYSTYFDSTKTNSNEFVGALGLGSKSPFSYTDNFVVVATKNGETNSYSAFINDVGVPSIVRLGTTNTGAPNGVKVELAVSEKDFGTFKQELFDVIKWYDLKPITNISTPYGFEVKYKPLNPFSVPFDSGVVTSESASSSYTPISVVLMGGVAYPIDGSRKEFSEYQNLLKQRIVVKAEIGDVEPQPSREGLTYSPETIAFIVNFLETLNKKIQDNLMTTVDSIDGVWNKVEFLNKTRSPLLSSSVEGLITKNGWDKIEIKLQDDTVKQFRRFVKRGSGRFASNRKEFQNLNLKSLATGTIQFYWVDNPGFKVSDVTGATAAVRANQIIVIYPTKGFSAKAFSKDCLYDAKILPLSSSFTLSQKASAVKTTFFEIKRETRSPRWFRDSPKEILSFPKLQTVPVGAKYYTLIKNRKIDIIGNYAHCTDSNGVRILFDSKFHTECVAVTKTGEKLAKAVGLTLVWDAIEEDIEKEYKKAQTEDFDKLCGVYIKESSQYNYSIPKKPDEITQAGLLKIKDEKLVALWSVDKTHKPSWIFEKKYKDIERVKNEQGVSIRESVRTILEAPRKYAAINFDALTDESQAIKLINFVFENQ